VYSRAPPIIQEDPQIKVIFAVLQAAWNRDYTRFYALISEAEAGSVQLDAVIISLLQNYRCMSSSCWFVNSEDTWQARAMALLSKVYTTIPPERATEYLGLSNDLVVDGIYKAIECD